MHDYNLKPLIFISSDTFAPNLWNDFPQHGYAPPVALPAVGEQPQPEANTGIYRFAYQCRAAVGGLSQHSCYYRYCVLKYAKQGGYDEKSVTGPFVTMQVGFSSLQYSKPLSIFESTLTLLRRLIPGVTWCRARSLGDGCMLPAAAPASAPAPAAAGHSYF